MLAGEMAGWEYKGELNDGERDHIRQAIQGYPHRTSCPDLHVAGVDGSGDYPSLTYSDSFVYLSTAAAVQYDSDDVVGLKERSFLEPLVEFTWLPEAEERRRSNLLGSFERLAGLPLEQVIERSDYGNLKLEACGWGASTAAILKDLIVPHAADSGNLSIQLRSSAELGAGLRALDALPRGGLLLLDGTLSLPFVARKKSSLFHEHLKRLLCVTARESGVAVVWISKSAGLAGEDALEALAREKLGLTGPAEHWFVRLEADSRFPLLDTKRVPPRGAVSYLLRTHRTVPLLRVDVDRAWWESAMRGGGESETIVAERRFFGLLDYAGHDQRSFGYPYPIKAAHDRASLMGAERLALKKQIIDAAVAAGMKRAMFRDASLQTGHGRRTR